MRARVASAGTGKTTILVRRYLELLADHPPYRLAAVTFTRAATAQIRIRIVQGWQTLYTQGSYAGFHPSPEVLSRIMARRSVASSARIHTIHGFFAELLRSFAPLLGLDPAFAVLAPGEAQAVFMEAVRAEYFLHPVEGLPVATLLALFKKRGQSESFYPEGEAADKALSVYRAAERRYRGRLSGRMLGPADLELRAIDLLRHPSEALLQRLRQRLAYVLVDEYQDTSPLQGAAFEALDDAGVSVEVVGDPKQSIYGFRDADLAVFQRALEHAEVLEPLEESHRHAPELVDFLNRIVRGLSIHSWAFAQGGAGEVRPVRDGAGAVELHWVEGQERLEELRALEARVLSGRLAELHREGRPFGEMVVLMRSRGSLQALVPALLEYRIPFVRAQDRGYYTLLELRDLYHALVVGLSLEPKISLAAFLHGPFGGLDTSGIDRMLQAPEGPQAYLAHHFPEVRQRIRTIHDWVAGERPLAALERLVYTPFLDGRRFMDSLSNRARSNVEALLLQFAARPPLRIEALLSELEDRRFSSDEVGGVPEGGESAVRLFTVHGAKGLEWPVVAVFDVSRGVWNRPEPFLLEPGSGRLAMAQDPAYAELAHRAREQAEQEAERILYVALSRPRDRLIISGSLRFKSGSDRPAANRGSWAHRLLELQVNDWPEVSVHHWRPDQPPATAPLADRETAGPLPAPPPSGPFPAAQLPPVFSPSALKREWAESAEDEAVLGEDQKPWAGRDFAKAVGILTHYAISQNWQPSDPAVQENLRAQAVLFSYTEVEQDAILADVNGLLDNFWALYDTQFPQPREQDYAELPLAHPHGATVWTGVIDRLYRVGGAWYLEDYKTDRKADPAPYLFQLALYRRAIKEAWGLEPLTRLVFLRDSVVIPLEPSELEEAFQRGVGQAEGV